MYLLIAIIIIIINNHNWPIMPYLECVRERVERTTYRLL